MDLWQPAELAIHDAMQAVEKMPADIRLTNAVILLIKAKDLVSDFIDDNPNPLGEKEALKLAIAELEEMKEMFRYTQFGENDEHFENMPDWDKLVKVISKCKSSLEKEGKKP